MVYVQKNCEEELAPYSLWLPYGHKWDWFWRIIIGSWTGRAAGLEATLCTIDHHLLPFKNGTNRENKPWFCDFLSEWEEEGFMHLAPLDEFLSGQHTHQKIKMCVVSKHKGGYWKECDCQEMVHPGCIGGFLCFTIKKPTWIFKSPQGESWNGIFNRRPFLQDEKNVSLNVTPLYDKAPCFKAMVTQKLLKDSEIDFFGNIEWSRNSPDLNVAENIGAILKNQVKTLMHTEGKQHGFSKETLQSNQSVEGHKSWYRIL